MITTKTFCLHWDKLIKAKLIRNKTKKRKKFLLFSIKIFLVLRLKN